MRYQNIEIHNIGELIPCEEGGVRWLRVPQTVYDTLETEPGIRQAKGSTGVELRFVMKSQSAKLILQSLSDRAVLTTFQIYFGGLQGGWQCHEVDKLVGTEPTEFVITRPENMDTLHRMNEQAGLDWDPEVVRIIFNRGEYRIVGIEGDIEPPKASQTPKRTLLTYGSSITHGSNSYASPNNWASVVAHDLNVDLRNLGMAGSCAMEPEMVEYIASLGEQGQWDVATLELGINVLEWEDGKITERVTNTITQIAGRNSDKPVYVISPFYCSNDFHGEGLADKWRRMIEEICNKLNFPNVTYINGLELLGDMSLISADEVHPNIYGVAQIARRLTDIMQK